jgi:hypothetical protein
VLGRRPSGLLRLRSVPAWARLPPFHASPLHPLGRRAHRAMPPGWPSHPVPRRRLSFRPALARLGHPAGACSLGSTSEAGSMPGMVAPSARPVALYRSGRDRCHAAGFLDRSRRDRSSCLSLREDSTLDSFHRTRQHGYSALVPEIGQEDKTKVDHY